MLGACAILPPYGPSDVTLDFVRPAERQDTELVLGGHGRDSVKLLSVQFSTRSDLMKLAHENEIFLHVRKWLCQRGVQEDERVDELVSRIYWYGQGIRPYQSLSSNSSNVAMEKTPAGKLRHYQMFLEVSQPLHTSGIYGESPYPPYDR
jgi:hypothetical protein